MKTLKHKKQILSLAALVSVIIISLPGQALAATCKNSSSKELQRCLKTNPIISDLQTIVNVLSAGVGIVVVTMIIVGGIQYSIAGDSPEKLKEAKKRISNALIALVTFMFLFGFVQWLIPGGVFP